MPHLLLLFALAAQPEPVAAQKATPPAAFVYLRDVAPTIEQEMRYASAHNFTGEAVPGYQAAECLLTQVTAHALAQAQGELNRFGLGLKVYDCYRPVRAVRFFSDWAQRGAADAMAQEFYPNLAKAALHSQGYIAHQSGHSRGSTVDLTLVPYPREPPAPTVPSAPLRPCTLPAGQRFAHNSLDMGTGFDCLDPQAHTECPRIGAEARRNRLLLRQVMRRYGLINYPKEWWHYTYFNEPFRHQAFDFVVVAPKMPAARP